MANNIQSFGLLFERKKILTKLKKKNKKQKTNKQKKKKQKTYLALEPFPSSPSPTLLFRRYHFKKLIGCSKHSFSSTTLISIFLLDSIMILVNAVFSTVFMMILYNDFFKNLLFLWLFQCFPSLFHVLIRFSFIMIFSLY